MSTPTKSGVRCQESGLRDHVSKKNDKVVELVGEGLLSTEPTASRLNLINPTKLSSCFVTLDGERLFAIGSQQIKFHLKCIILT